MVLPTTELAKNLRHGSRLRFLSEPARVLVAILSLTCVGIAFPTPQARADELQAEEIRAWEFQRSEDRNSDQWPDGWRRRTGRQYPSYIPIKLTPRDPEAARTAKEAQFTLSQWWLAYQQGKFFQQVIPERTPEAITSFMDRWVIDSCLQIEMNGGSVELESPVIPLDPRYTYSMDSSLSTSDLSGHRAWIEINFLNESGTKVGSLQTAPVSGDKPWHTHMTNNFADESLRKAQVVIHVDSITSRAIKGIVRVDGIRIYQMPKIDVRMDLPHNVGEPNTPFEVTCAVLGIKDIGSSVNFRLVDFRGREIARTTSTLQQQPSLGNSRSPKPLAKDDPAGTTMFVRKQTSEDKQPIKVETNPTDSLSGERRNPNDSQRIDGVAKWNLQVAEPGFYRVVVDLGRTTYRTQSRTVSLAVAPPGPIGQGGPFGWSLPALTGSIQPEDVPGLINAAGIGWLKIPVWFHEDDMRTADRLALLLERLDHKKVACVGRLEQPPSTNVTDAPPKPLPVASVFANPEVWEPQLEAVLTRMSMKLGWFQLGKDDDLSFIGNSKLIPLLTDIRNRMQTYSQELQLAIAWEWQDSLPIEKTLPWRSSQMSASPQLTAEELRSYLTAAQQTGQMPWATLNPLPASRYSLLDRCRDLAERMIVIKQTGAHAAFVTTPLDADTGIFNPDGSAGEMLLPWRILNRYLANAAFLGSVRLPSGSTNYVFSTPDDTIMITWNDRETYEQLYLGDTVGARDVWGKTVPVSNVQSDHGTPEQRLAVGPWPTVITGLHRAVAKWRISFQASSPDLAKQVGNQASMKILVENSFDNSLQGTVALHSPSLLQASATGIRLQLGPAERREIDYPLALKSDASAGKHTLRFDFVVNGDEAVAFSTYDNMALGISDVEIQWDAILDDAGNVNLHMELNNKTNRPLSFDCKLFPPKHPYRRFQISAAPPGHTVRDMPVPFRGIVADSILWLQCEELGTGRVLNYRVPVRTSL